MRKLDWYILRKFLGTFVFAIMILAVLICVIDYSEKVDNFMKKKTPLNEMVVYFVNFVPSMIAFLLPLFIFIATIFFTSKMAYRSEIISILASGISFPRFLRAYFVGATLICCISLIANHWLVPRANKVKLAFENKYINDPDNGTEQSVHLRLSPELYIYVQSFNRQSNIGSRFTAETISGTELKEKLMAETVVYDSTQKIWKLKNVTTRTNNGLRESLTYAAELEKKYPFSPKDLERDKNVMTTMTTQELQEVIAREKMRGRESMNLFYVELNRRTAQPFAGMILTLIGACIACRRVRGGSGFHLAIGIVISAAYILALQLTNTFSINAGLNATIATWIPNIVFGAVALFLYRRQVT